MRAKCLRDSEMGKVRLSFPMATSTKGHSRMENALERGCAASVLLEHFTKENGVMINLREMAHSSRFLMRF